MDKLISFILEYESDTFSASRQNLSREQAAKIAEKLIEKWITSRLDGHILSGVCEELFEFSDD